jgi:hypothetical protein
VIAIGDCTKITLLPLKQENDTSGAGRGPVPGRGAECRLRLLQSHEGKVTKDKKNTLVLHGLGGDHNNLMRSPASNSPTLNSSPIRSRSSSHPSRSAHAGSPGRWLRPGWQDYARQWIKARSDLKMNIPKGMPEIFRFFAEHTKP